LAQINRERPGDGGFTPGLTVVSGSAENVAAMHASISTFRRDPDELLARYDAMLAEVSTASFREEVRS
jgi:hypothetical protein